MTTMQITPTIDSDAESDATRCSGHVGKLMVVHVSERAAAVQFALHSRFWGSREARSLARGGNIVARLWTRGLRLVHLTRIGRVSYISMTEKRTITNKQ
jgi:hypothetical protein